MPPVLFWTARGIQMSKIKSIDDLDAKGKKVLVRVDFNVPIKDGVVADDTRIQRALPTIKKLVGDGAKVIIASHLGRPSGTGYEEAFSLAPAAKRLSELVDTNVSLASDISGDNARELIDNMNDGDIVVLENVRFDSREKKNDAEFARQLADLADLYVNDAFGTAHRAHASTAGVANYLPAYAGYLMLNEVETLSSMMDDPKRPFVAILGGSKVSDKIKIIESLLDKADTLIIGGAMCFTFLLAQGHDVGKSLVEPDWVDRASEMMEKAKKNGVKLLLPVDVVVAKDISEDAPTEVVSVDNIPADMMGLDIGPETDAIYADAISKAACVFWNGPMGVFEMAPFAEGTKAIADAVAANTAADTVIGGGDSVAAVNKFGVADKMTFISTGGGASMELVQGEKLPGVEALR